MTKFQASILSIGIFIAGIAVAVVGGIIKNDTLMGFGIGIAGSGLTGLGIPRPQDMA